MNAQVHARARRELIAARHIPYSAFIAPEILRTANGDCVQTLRVGGLAFESADDESVNAWHERLNALWRNVASPHVAVWLHVVRGSVRVGGDVLRAGDALAAHDEDALRIEGVEASEILLFDLA